MLELKLSWRTIYLFIYLEGKSKLEGNEAVKNCPPIVKGEAREFLRLPLS